MSALTVLEKFLQGKGATELDQQKGVHRKRLIPLPVHRLDQYTSGIICFAMNPKARESLVRQVRDHTLSARSIWRLVMANWIRSAASGAPGSVLDERGHVSNCL